MKKKAFVKLANNSLFENFADKKLNSLQSIAIQAGTTTTLCRTLEDAGDTDFNGIQESLGDSRCSGY